ncbi:MAG: Crp/Fnr family transcriptional regulator [Oscillospiraceae bacterium]
MDYPLALLLKTPLFAGLTESRLQSLLPLLAPQSRQYQKGEIVLIAGYENRDILVVTEGRAEAVKETGGAPFTVARLGPGGVIGDVLAGSHTKSPVTVKALTPCCLLAFKYSLFLQPPGADPALHRLLLTNLVALIADKYFALNERVDLLLVHGLRRRLAAYLLAEAERAGSASFAIAYNRAQLAAHLGCERSALCRVLSAMVRQGLVQTGRARFTLLQPQALRALL